MEQWYTVHTKPNAEYQVAATFHYRQIETYLPEVEVPKVQQGRERKPFFPCYLFVKTDFEVVGFSQLQWTPGLRRIVVFDDQPVPLADEIINLIRHRVEAVNTGGSQPGHIFQPGDTVQITNGPLEGLLAIFEGPTTPNDRVQVLLTFLGQVSRARVPITCLEKAPPSTKSELVSRPRRTRGQGRQINYQQI